MTPAMIAAFTGITAVLVGAAFVVRHIRRTTSAQAAAQVAVRVAAAESRLRARTLEQLAENNREHARALLKCAEELFTAGHAATAAMLEMHATDYELRAEDNDTARADNAQPLFPARERALSA